MKITFILLFLAALSAFGIMRYHQFQFEKSSQLKFDVMKFELPGSKENLNRLILDWSLPESKEFVLEQLKLDYFFMSTLFPAILMGCLLVRRRLQEKAVNSNNISKYGVLSYLLLGLAFMQLFAWLFDISENIRLTIWIKQGYAGNMLLFETLVKLKFLFAILGVLLSLGIFGWLRVKRNK
jgi:hypothetical protein